MPTPFRRCSTDLFIFFLSDGPSESAGDGHRGCTLHAHPGEMFTSHKREVRVYWPKRPHNCLLVSS